LSAEFFGLHICDLWETLKEYVNDKYLHITSSRGVPPPVKESKQAIEWLIPAICSSSHRPHQHILPKQGNELTDRENANRGGNWSWFGRRRSRLREGCSRSFWKARASERASSSYQLKEK